MPAPAQSWTLHRAAWLEAYVGLVVCLAAGCLLWLSWFFLPLLLMLLRYRRKLFSDPSPRGARLGITGQGQWLLLDKGSRTRLFLQHVWPSSAWISLHFIEAGPDGSTRTHRYTVWRSSLEAHAWRELRIAVERSGMAFLPRVAEAP